MLLLLTEDLGGVMGDGEFGEVGLGFKLEKNSVPNRAIIRYHTSPIYKLVTGVRLLTILLCMISRVAYHGNSYHGKWPFWHLP